MWRGRLEEIIRLPILEAIQKGPWRRGPSSLSGVKFCPAVADMANDSPVGD
jgi:hypothetical protein